MTVKNFYRLLTHQNSFAAEISATWQPRCFQTGSEIFSLTRETNWSEQQEGDGYPTGRTSGAGGGRGGTLPAGPAPAESASKRWAPFAGAAGATRCPPLAGAALLQGYCFKWEGD